MLNILLAFILYFTPAQQSQDCAINADLSNALAIIETAIGANDTEAVLSDASAFIKALSDLNIACHGLQFSNEANGMQPLIGPINLTEGVYRVTATTDSFIILEIEVLEGECRSEPLFSLFEGQAVGGAQAVYRSSGCEVLIQIRNTFEPWTVTFEQLR